jgi:uncharacterized membrane protein YkvA (DUF1232 family)
MKEYFTDGSFWEKLKKGAKKAGGEVVYACLLLYFVLQKPDVPLWAKGIIISALGYFILPLDAIPDITPGVGYTDDLGAVIVALGQVAIYIDEDVRKKALDKTRDWFGEDFDSSLVDNKI